MIKKLNYEESDLKKLHEIQIEIMKEIIRICNKHNLKWFVTYGTLLGTVRHNGFIPWDDDIDIGMIREDYDKFLQIAQNELGDDFYLSHYLIDNKIPHYFTKIRKNNTLFVEESVSKINMHHGIFVDIFPCDKVPPDKKKNKRHSRKLIIYNKMFVAKSTSKACDNSSRIKYFFNSCIKKLLRCAICGVSKSKLYEKLDKLARKYGETDSNFVTFMSDPTKSLIGLTEIFPTIKMKFEGIEVEVPNAYEKVLAGNYGDKYMELPPERERVNHAPMKLSFDTKII